MKIVSFSLSHNFHTNQSRRRLAISRSQRYKMLMRLKLIFRLTISKLNSPWIRFLCAIACGNRILRDSNCVICFMLMMGTTTGKRSQQNPSAILELFRQPKQLRKRHFADDGLRHCLLWKQKKKKQFSVALLSKQCEASRLQVSHVAQQTSQLRIKASKVFRNYSFHCLKLLLK